MAGGLIGPPGSVDKTSVQHCGVGSVSILGPHPHSMSLTHPTCFVFQSLTFPTLLPMPRILSHIQPHRPCLSTHPPLLLTASGKLTNVSQLSLYQI